MVVKYTQCICDESPRIADAWSGSLRMRDDMRNAFRHRLSSERSDTFSEAHCWNVCGLVFVYIRLDPFNICILCEMHNKFDLKFKLQKKRDASASFGLFKLICAW